jgi:hypothetical protein
MWIINLLPDWVFYSILFLGIIGLIATYLLRFIPIPNLYIYKIPVQVISIILIVLGTYMSGAISNEATWKAKVAELEKKYAESQLKSEKINTETTVKYVTKREVIRQKGEEQIRYIDREIVKYNDNCKLPKDVITLHNEAAKGVK